MKSKHIQRLCALFVCAVSLSCISVHSTTQIYQSTLNPVSSYDLASRIIVDNNWTETEAAGICTGEGTPENPYLIHNKEIDAGGVGSAIWIKDTDEYFKISSCFLNDSGITPKDSGIYLYNVSNGIIFNSTFRGRPESSNCIYMEYTHNINITHNIMRNEWGVFHDVGCSNIAIFYNNLLSSLSSLFFTNYSSTRYRTETKWVYTYENENYTNYIGNYWNDQTHIDEDGDGISDVSVEFTNSHVWIVDPYQLMEPIQNYVLIEEYVEQKIPGYNVFIIAAIMAFSILLILWKRYDVK